MENEVLHALSKLTIKRAASPLKVATPKTYAAFLKGEIKALVARNDVEVVEAARTKAKDLVKKVNNFLERQLLEESADTVLQKIIDDPLFRAHFRKDVSKQGIHESTQVAWLRRFHEDLVVLDKRCGPCLCDGAIVDGATRPAAATKTLDAHIPSTHTYCVLKYTSEAGGAQDNQFNDVKDFIKQFVVYLENNTEANDNLTCYLDGAYYTPKKYELLRSLVPATWTSRITITCMESLIESERAKCLDPVEPVQDHKE